MDFVEAIRLFEVRGFDSTGVLIGMVDEDNLVCIPQAQLASWQANGVIEWRE
jgi:hypothetical protein